jgi:uncharacterized protein (TIGR04168 family)
MQGCRLAIVGDIHSYWTDDDAEMLSSLEVDHVVFVGDFANEDPDLLRNVKAQLLEYGLAFSAVLGNHDAWATTISTVAGSIPNKRIPKFDPLRVGLVNQSIAILGKDHIGYGNKDVSLHDQIGFSLIGGRPCSWGGNDWSGNLFGAPAFFFEQMFGVKGFDESAARIVEQAALTSFPDKIFVAHNGPSGLGKLPTSPVGRDWGEFGDWGDPDLEDAISTVSCKKGVSVPLCCFGHMHNDVKVESPHGREMCAEKAGTVYVNAAMVPRIRPATTYMNTTGDSGATTRRTACNTTDACSQKRHEHCFTLVDLLARAINASNTRVLAVSRVRQLWVDSVDFGVVDECITYDASCGGVQQSAATGKSRL